MTFYIHLLTLAFVSFISFFWALCFGAIEVNFNDVWQAIFNYNEAQLQQKVVFELRLPRTILAFFAGSGLALAGLILQTVTRNPLADPYLFGISSGASLGVVILFTLTGISSGIVMAGAAFVGSMLSMGLLLGITYRACEQVTSIILTGVALSFLFGALTSLLLYLTDPQAISAILFWTLGSFSRAQWPWLWLPCVVVIGCMIVMLLYRRILNTLLLGDESATTLGVSVEKVRIGMLLVSSLLTAVLVAMCGGIGFVGLMIPHIVRFFISQATILGMVYAACLGGVFMVWVDVLARSMLADQELPIGVITSSIGSVFFLTLLHIKKRNRE